MLVFIYFDHELLLSFSFSFSDLFKINHFIVSFFQFLRLSLLTMLFIELCFLCKLVLESLLSLDFLMQIFSLFSFYGLQSKSFFSCLIHLFH